MVDAPERIWVGPDGYWAHSEKTGHHRVEYVRADIAASQVAEALRGNRYAELEAIARKKLAEARATVVAAWNAFGGHVADDYDETKDVALVAGGDLAEQIAELSNQRNAAEAERDRWKGEYLNACRDAASFSDDLVKAEADRDRLAAEVTRLKEALCEHVTENVWNAYHIGIERDGRWMDGARSEGEWLARELELPDGWNDAALVKSMLPGLVDRIVARAAIRAMEVKHDA